MACPGSGQTVLNFLGLTAATCGSCSSLVAVEYHEGIAWIVEHNPPSSTPDVRRLEAENDRLRAALAAARDFVEHHPAVSGEWPILVDLINGALSGSAAEAVVS